jgi:2-pyrone-4,6-dicarboxylate lactonase
LIETPRLWDCHAHVFGDRDRFPLASDRDYDPPHAPLDAYLAMLDQRGITDGVLVQPSVYGFDNACLLDALDRGDGRVFGVVVPAPDTRLNEFDAMHKRGVRGVRCNLLNAGGLQPRVVLRWQPKLRDLGWHIVLQVGVESIADLDAYLHGFDVPVVIDHMGRPVPGHADPAARGLQALLEAVRSGRCFVKLSAPYRLSISEPPWPDVTPLARALLAANPGACMWGSDWPHPDTRAAISDDDVFRALDQWCPDDESRRVLLSAAPQKLYRSK